MTRPNIVLILADDMGLGDIGAYGNDAVETPAIDFLASEGVRLTGHYSASPVCAPARAGLLTGRYPHRTGAIDTLEGRGLDRLALREVTLADAMKQAGYATGLVGKWHLGALDPRYHPNRRGFDEFVGFRGGWQDYLAWRLDINGAPRAADGRYLTDVFTDEAVACIERHHGEPFLLHVAYNAPHFPLQAPDEDIAPFRETGRFTDAVCRIYGMNRRMDRGIERILRALERHRLDENTIVLFLSDNGPQFGGQGEADTTRFNGDLNGCKGTVYEGGIRVPAIARWPGVLHGGRRVDGFVHFIDWLPTLLDAAGIPLADGVPAGDEPADDGSTRRSVFPDSPPIDGRSVLPLLGGESEDGPPRRFWQWNRYTPEASCNAAIRDGAWKLVRPILPEAMRLAETDIDVDRRLKYEPESVSAISSDPEPERVLPPPPPPLLFRLDEDPGERNDRSAEYPDRARDLGDALDRWFTAVDAERRSIAFE